MAEKEDCLHLGLPREIGKPVGLRELIQEVCGQRSHRLGLGPRAVAHTAPYLPTLTDHDVVTVPVTDAQHIGGPTVASTGEGELFDSSIQGLPGWGRLKAMATPLCSCFHQRWSLFPSPSVSPGGLL
jgi:hypothetical protein